MVSSSTAYNCLNWHIVLCNALFTSSIYAALDSSTGSKGCAAKLVVLLLAHAPRVNMCAFCSSKRAATPHAVQGAAATDIHDVTEHPQMSAADNVWLVLCASAGL
jgi:hypothetical protein